MIIQLYIGISILSLSLSLLMYIYIYIHTYEFVCINTTSSVLPRQEPSAGLLSPPRRAAQTTFKCIW